MAVVEMINRAKLSDAWKKDALVRLPDEDPPERIWNDAVLQIEKLIRAEEARGA